MLTLPSFQSAFARSHLTTPIINQGLKPSGLSNPSTGKKIRICLLLNGRRRGENGGIGGHSGSSVAPIGRRAQRASPSLTILLISTLFLSISHPFFIFFIDIFKIHFGFIFDQILLLFWHFHILVFSFFFVRYLPK